MSVVFTGESLHAVDSQRRLAIPKPWRGTEEAPAAYYLLPGHHGSIHAFPRALFERQFVAKAEQTSFANEEEADALAGIGACTLYQVVDRQGRFCLTPELMRHAQLTDQAVIVGSFTVFRIQHPENWTARRPPIDKVLKHVQALQERPTRPAAVTP